MVPQKYYAAQLFSQHQISMITEKSCDTKDWIMIDNSPFHHRKIYYNIYI